MKTLTKNKIKEAVGDAWALIYDPIFSKKDNTFLKGKLAFWNKNKDKVEKEVLKDKNPKKHFTIRFFGKIPDDAILVNFF